MRTEPYGFMQAVATPSLSRRPLIQLPGSLWRAVWRGCIGGLLLAALFELTNVYLGRNFHTVIPGFAYRCSQPSASALNDMIQRHGIRTVVNLRGCCDPTPWYLDECRTALAHDVSQEDLPFSAGKLPPVHVVRELVRVMDGSAKPLLFHCHKGIDRTGMASTLALLLYTDATLAQARGQLGMRFGHLSFGRTGNMDRFFTLYEEWLAERGATHSRDNIRQWIEKDYCAGECSCDIKLVEPSGAPLRAPRDRPFGVTVRCRNSSVKAWRLRPGNNAGIHAEWVLTDANDQLVANGRAGLFHAVVAPQQEIDLVLSLPSLRESGRYHLRVDMADEQHARFMQEGSEPLFVDVEVP